MCRSGTAYPVRILVLVQTALSLVFTYSLFPRLTPAGILVLVQTALSLVFTYSDSLRAVHTHGVAIFFCHCEPRQWRGNPVNQYPAHSRVQHLHSGICSLTKNGAFAPFFTAYCRHIRNRLSHQISVSTNQCWTPPYSHRMLFH